MRKISVVSGQPPRKLVAVIGLNNDGFYYKNTGDITTYFNLHHMDSRPHLHNFDLETLLNQERDRKPVYEGDKIEIQF